MTAKRRLGRGLGALLDDAPTTDLTDPPRRGLMQIAIDRIVPNPNQPRRTFDASALDALQASIVEFGILVPIIVRSVGDRYELIAGERRWRAARAAALTTISAIVRQADDRESLEVAIIENLQRENLDALEEAMGFAHLIEAYGFTQERVAERLGRSRPAIANSLRLMGLADEIKALLRQGAISAGHARALLALPEQQREEVARRIATDGLTVRAVEDLARPAPAIKAARRVPPAQQPLSNDHADVLERLRYRFATAVTFAHRGRGGTIELRYADNADLIRIVDLLLGESASA